MAEDANSEGQNQQSNSETNGKTKKTATKTTLIGKGCKWLGPWTFKQIWVILFLMLLGMTDLSDSRQQNYFTPNNQQITQKQSSFNQNQFIIFDEIGEMSSQMMYIHVNVPLNLSALYHQANLFTNYLYTLKNTTTSTYKRIPFTKAVRDTGDFGLRRLERIMKRLENIDHNLPHVDSREKREAKIRKRRGDQACIHGYSSHPENCDLEHDVAQMALDPLAAIIEAIRGPNYEDTDEYKQGQIDRTLWTHSKWEKQNLEYFVSPKPDFPESYWEAFSPTPAPPVTTFRPWDKNSGETFKKYLNKKTDALIKDNMIVYKEKKLAKEIQSKIPLPEFYYTTPKPTIPTFRPRDVKSGEDLRQFRLAKEAEFGRLWRLMKRNRKWLKNRILIHQ